MDEMLANEKVQEQPDVQDEAAHLFQQKRDHEMILLEKQIQDIDIIVKRVSIWGLSITQTKTFLETRIQVLEGFVSKAMMNMNLFSLDELGSLKETRNAFKAINASSVKLIKILKDTTAECIRRQQNVIGGASKDIIKMATALKTTLQSSRKQCDASWSGYIHAARKHDGSDAAIEARALIISLQALENIQNESCVQLQSIMNRMHAYDRKRIEALRTLCMEYFVSEKKVLYHVIKTIDDMIEVVNSINGERDIQECIQTLNLYQPNEEPLQRGDSTENEKLISLLKRSFVFEGHLQRPGRVISSNWKDSYSIITDTGKFYQFDSETSATPSLSLSLCDCQILHNPEVDPLSFTLSCNTKQTIFSFSNNPSNYCLKAMSAPQLIKWVTNLKRFVQKTQ